MSGVSILESYKVMNWRRVVLVGCGVAYAFAASSSTAQIMSQGNSVSRIGTHRAFTPPSIARPRMHRARIMNSGLGLRGINGFNHRAFHGDDGFHRFHRFNKIIFIRNFGFPWAGWQGWNWGYYANGPYEYPEYSYPSYNSYPSYYSSYGYGYGNYVYGYAPLLYYGGYHSTTNSDNDESVVRDILAEYTVSWNRHDTAALGRFFTENCDYVDMAGVHWKGVHEIVQRQAEVFQHRSKTAVRRLTGAEVSFSTPDVALVHATWNLTGSSSRPTGKAVPVLKEITMMKMVKTNGKWLITDFQDTKSNESTQ